MFHTQKKIDFMDKLMIKLWQKKKHNCPNTKPPMKTGKQDTQRCGVQKAFLDPPHKVNLRKIFLLVLPCKPK